MKEQYVFDEQKSFRDLVDRSKNIGNGWRKVSDGLWNFVKLQASKQPAVFEIDDEKKLIRFADYY